MSDNNPYAAPQTVQLATREEEPAEALPLVAREYRTFCRGMALLYWCYSLPLFFVMASVQRSESWLLIRLVYELFVLAGCLLATRVPHGGRIRWGVNLAAIFQLAAVLMLLMQPGSGFPLPAKQLWVADKLLAGMSLMAAIWGLGIELDSASMRNCGRTALACMGLHLLIVGVSLPTVNGQDIHSDLFMFIAVVVIMTMYCAGWAALFFAWRMPSEITARMKRCFPNQFDVASSATPTPQEHQAAAKFLRELGDREQAVEDISLPMEEEL